MRELNVTISDLLALKEFVDKVIAFIAWVLVYLEGKQQICTRAE